MREYKNSCVKRRLRPVLLVHRSDSSSQNRDNRYEAVGRPIVAAAAFLGGSSLHANAKTPAESRLRARLPAPQALMNRDLRERSFTAKDLREAQ